MGDPTTDNYIVTGGFFDRPTGCLNANGKAAGSATQQDAEQNMLVAETVRSHPRPGSNSVGNLTVTHSLRADGFDASEDGTGRGTPLVPIAIQERAVCENPLAGPDGVGVREDGLAYTLEGRQVPQAVAYGISNQPTPKFGNDVMPTLNSHNLGGGMQEAVAFQSSQSGIREVNTHATLDSNNGSRRHNGVLQAMQVRRLTPEECESLQGFPRGYTKISDKTADGSRYKALGNSFAVPVVHWIGRRIQLVNLFS
jgi:DNA (cytosine-5)-methyltransferase 1